MVGGTWFKKLVNKYAWKHDSRDTGNMTDHVVFDQELMKNTFWVTEQRGAYQIIFCY